MPSVSETYDFFDCRAAEGAQASVFRSSRFGEKLTCFGRQNLFSVKSTKTETMALAAGFAVAAASVCGTSYLCGTSLPQVLGFGALGAIAVHGAYHLYERLALDIIPDHRPGKNYGKVAYLQGRAQEYKEKLGLKQTPEIRVIYKKSLRNNAFFLNRYGTRPLIGFGENMLRNCSLNELDGLLGHEMAHATQKSFGLFVESLLFFSGMFSGSLLLFECSTFAGLFLARALSRRAEFQADRIGAVVSGKPMALAKAIKRDEPPFPEEKYRIWRALSRKDKAFALCVAFLAFPIRAVDGSLHTHPFVDRRVERLQTMHRPPRRYRSDSIKMRMARFLP
ncbi:MAG: M48 family metalloprotease [Alphaproteobacteria bacterium]|nr:M48 family metalloprotease [Alphaproteobacteria bacterium]